MEMVGSAEPMNVDEEEERPRAVLWVPDPEQRLGWREWYVYPPKPANHKPLGYEPQRREKRGK